MGERQEQLYPQWNGALVMGTSPAPGMRFGKGRVGTEGHPRVLLPHSRALEQAGKGPGAHPNIPHDLWQEKDPTGMRDCLGLGSALDGTEPMVALAELGSGLGSMTLEVFSNLNDDSMELSSIAAGEEGWE